MSFDLDNFAKDLKKRYNITRSNREIVQDHFDEFIEDVPFKDKWIAETMLTNIITTDSVSIENMKKGLMIYTSDLKYMSLEEYVKERYHDKFIDEFEEQKVSKLITDYLVSEEIFDYIVDNEYMNEHDLFSYQDEIIEKESPFVEDFIFNDTKKYIFDKDVLFSFCYNCMERFMKESEQTFVPCTRLIDIYFDNRTKYQIGLDQNVAINNKGLVYNAFDFELGICYYPKGNELIDAMEQETKRIIDKEF